MGILFLFKKGDTPGIVSPLNRSVNPGKRTGGAGKKNNTGQKNPQNVFHRFSVAPLRHRRSLNRRAII
jgi:hypothetical protein